MAWPERYMTVMGWTNKFQMQTMWTMQSTKICEQYKQMQMKFGNPAGQALSMVGNMALQNVGLPGIPECGANPQCMSVVGSRCVWYRNMTYVSMGVLGGFGVAWLTVVLCMVYLMMSSSKQAKKIALGGFSFACFVNISCCATYMIATDVMLKMFGSMAYHPYLSLSVGAFLNAAGCGIMSIGVICAVCSVMPKKQADDNLMGNEYGGYPMGGTY